MTLKLVRDRLRSSYIYARSQARACVRLLTKCILRVAHLKATFFETIFLKTTFFETAFLEAAFFEIHLRRRPRSPTPLERAKRGLITAQEARVAPRNTMVYKRGPRAPRLYTPCQEEFSQPRPSMVYTERDTGPPFYTPSDDVYTKLAQSEHPGMSRRVNPKAISTARGRAQQF